jgi:hypothetical protein
MQVELVNSNHNSDSWASELAHTRAAFMRALGVSDMVVVNPALWRSVATDAARWRGSAAAADPRPPHLWKARDFAKQAGISEKAARALARRLPTVCVAPSHCCGCRGGTRGCDLRFIAKDAAAWLSQRRRIAR